MRKAVIKAIVFVSGLIFIALLTFGPHFLPGRPSQFNFGRLENGDSLEKVKSIMGKPTHTTSDANDIWCEWLDGRNFYGARFRAQKLMDRGYYRKATPD